MKKPEWCIRASSAEHTVPQMRTAMDCAWSLESSSSSSHPSARQCQQWAKWKVELFLSPMDSCVAAAPSCSRLPVRYRVRMLNHLHGLSLCFVQEYLISTFICSLCGRITAKAKLVIILSSHNYGVLYIRLNSWWNFLVCKEKFGDLWYPK